MYAHRILAACPSARRAQHRRETLFRGPALTVVPPAGFRPGSCVSLDGPPQPDARGRSRMSLFFALVLIGTPMALAVMELVRMRGSRPL